MRSSRIRTEARVARPFALLPGAAWQAYQGSAPGREDISAESCNCVAERRFLPARCEAAFIESVDVVSISVEERLPAQRQFGRLRERVTELTKLDADLVKGSGVGKTRFTDLMSRRHLAVQGKTENCCGSLLMPLGSSGMGGAFHFQLDRDFPSNSTLSIIAQNTASASRAIVSTRLAQGWLFTTARRRPTQYRIVDRTASSFW